MLSPDHSACLMLLPLDWSLDLHPDVRPDRGGVLPWCCSCGAWEPGGVVLYPHVINCSPLKQTWHRTFRRFCETTEYLMTGLELFQKSKYVYSL